MVLLEINYFNYKKGKFKRKNNAHAEHKILRVKKILFSNFRARIDSVLHQKYE